MNILVTQVSRVGSINWIKSLQQITSCELVIYGLDIYPKGYSAGSLLVDNYIEVCHELNSSEYIETIKKICTSYNIELLLSVMDDELQLLIKSNYFKGKLIAPSLECFSLFNDKYVASRTMQESGVLTPEIIENPFGKGKVIIRDRIAIGSRGVYIVDFKKEVYIENRFQSSRFMQEYIEGEEYTVDVLTDKDGSPLLIIPRKRIEIRQGISFKCQLIEDDDIIDICKRIYQQHYIPGISNVQFIKNQSGTYFIELNTRIGGTTIASIIGGFNFVELFLKHYIYNEPVKSLDNYQHLIAWGSIISRAYNEYIYPLN